MALVKSPKDLQVMFWEEITGIINRSDVSVRQSWQTNGAPDWKINDDVIFLQVTIEEGQDITQPFDDEWHSKGEDLLLLQGQTQVAVLKVIAYGPACFQNAMALKHRFMQGRRALRKQKIHIIPQTDTVVYAPELFQGRWWQRTDLVLKFNVLQIFETDVNAIKRVDLNFRAIPNGVSDVAFGVDAYVERLGTTVKDIEAYIKGLDVNVDGINAELKRFETLIIDR